MLNKILSLLTVSFQYGILTKVGGSLFVLGIGGEYLIANWNVWSALQVLGIFLVCIGVIWRKK